MSLVEEIYQQRIAAMTPAEKIERMCALNAWARWNVARVITEDHFLHANLPGYRDYAARTRFRLLPRVW